MAIQPTGEGRDLRPARHISPAGHKAVNANTEPAKGIEGTKGKGYTFKLRRCRFCGLAGHRGAWS
jgi:hypothetical protein